MKTINKMLVAAAMISAAIPSLGQGQTGSGGSGGPNTDPTNQTNRYDQPGSKMPGMSERERSRTYDAGRDTNQPFGEIREQKKHRRSFWDRLFGRNKDKDRERTQSDVEPGRPVSGERSGTPQP